jgi:6,7-dimethyl-8-ribityllumazine synthase
MEAHARMEELLERERQRAAHPRPDAAALRRAAAAHAGARRAATEAGASVDLLSMPGALEIPGTIAMAAEAQLYDGFVAIGVVIRGETYHFEIVAGESARGIMALTMDGIAIGNGILTVENEQQALVRADPTQKDKGGEAAKAAKKGQAAE